MSREPAEEERFIIDSIDSSIRYYMKPDGTGFYQKKRFGIIDYDRQFFQWHDIEKILEPYEKRGILYFSRLAEKARDKISPYYPCKDNVLSNREEI